MNLLDNVIPLNLWQIEQLFCRVIRLQVLVYEHVHWFRDRV